MNVVIMQPFYLFLRKHFHQLQKSDLYIFMDDVQFVKNGHHNRNRIKGASGLIWMTVPVLQKERSGQLLKDVEIDNKTDWKKKHWFSIKNNYSKSRFFKDYSDFFEDVYKRDWKKLVDINIYLIKNISAFLGIENKNFMLLSELNIRNENPTQRLIDICENLGASDYIVGTRAKDYMEEWRWEKTNVKLNYFEPVYPEYPQLYGEFSDNCSIIDLLFNCGKNSNEYIRGKCCEVQPA
ncbi:MAG: WbqC family protein [bacterium]